MSGKVICEGQFLNVFHLTQIEVIFSTLHSDYSLFYVLFFLSYTNFMHKNYGDWNEAPKGACLISNMS